MPKSRVNTADGSRDLAASEASLVSIPVPILELLDDFLTQFWDSFASKTAATGAWDTLGQFVEGLRSGPYGHFVEAFSLPPEAPDQAQALARLAEALEPRWRLFDEQLRLALRRRAAETGMTDLQAVKRRELMAAADLVLHGEMERPQAMRRGMSRRKLDSANNPVLETPADLEWWAACLWATHRILEAAEASLLDMSVDEYRRYRSRKSGASRQARLARAESPKELAIPLSLDQHEDLRDSLSDADADPLYGMLEREEWAEKSRELNNLQRYLTAGQRRILDYWSSVALVGGTPTVRGAAHSLGIKESTVYVQLSRLRAALRSRSKVV